MGSSIPQVQLPWILLAVSCGVLYLVFDALRSFALQLSPVRLRGLSSDVVEESSSLRRFELEDFQLVSGVLLQIALLVGAGSTAMLLADAFGVSVWRSVGFWAVGVIVWKFVLALIPEAQGETILRALIPVARISYYVFFPVLYPLRALLRRVSRHEDDSEEEEEVSEQQMQGYIDLGEEEGIIEPAEGRMLQLIVEFGDRLVHEIMTPRIDVIAFDAKRSIRELAAIFAESKYARIPIYEESVDRITGVVHVKDLLEAVLAGGTKSVAELARPPYFVSETKLVSELLREFQSEHIQLAVVVDEYGGTAGIVTNEDIVEEIVGEIGDEHEDEEATIVDLGDGTLMVSGLLRVEELEEKLDAELSGEDYETVAGMIFTTLGRVPAVGTIVTRNGFRFEVDRADRRRIYRVRVTPEPVAQHDEDNDD